MTNKHINFLLLLTLLLAGSWPLQATNDAWDGTEEGEAMARGPVHEAFAQPVPVEAGERYVIAHRPPEAIQELPPEEKPAGEQVIWIPGYWHYDDEANEFIWISGCWRAVPPGMAWIAGYWQETTEGFEWIAGYWYDNRAGGTSYLPEPPASLERGPSSVAPNEDYIWVSGNWVWQQGAWGQAGRYVWQPGYWLLAQPDRVWVPSYYTYTPYGYVYAGGYWDYALATRGVVFLPMRFTSGVYLRRGFYYSPRLVIGVDLFYSDFFFSLRRRHYYFGDYYAAHYVGLSYYPWFSVRSRVRVYDHLFVYARWTNRRDANWVQKQRRDYIYRQKHVEARPPRVYRPETPTGKNRRDGWTGRRGDGKTPIRPLKDIAREQGSGRFEKMAPQQRQEWSARNRAGTIRGNAPERGENQKTPGQRPDRSQRHRTRLGENMENKPDARPETTTRPEPRQQRNFSPARDQQPQLGGNRAATITSGSTATGSTQPQPSEVRPPSITGLERRRPSSDPGSGLTAGASRSGASNPVDSVPGVATGGLTRPSPRPASRSGASLAPNSVSPANTFRGSVTSSRGDFSGRSIVGGSGQSLVSPRSSSPPLRTTPAVGQQRPTLPSPSSHSRPESAGAVLEREQSPWESPSAAPEGVFRTPSSSGGWGRGGQSPSRSSFSGNRNSGRAGNRRGAR